jgi:hypothetical protein
MISICFGCIAHIQVHQASETVSSTSYKIYKGHLKRSVGRLRRLVLMPPQYTYILYEKRKPEWEAKAGQVMGEWAGQFLKNWRGYEIIYVEDLALVLKTSSTACSAEEKLF